MNATTAAEERRELLSRYASASRALADAAERLLLVHTEVESFIQALDVAGTAHRACEQARIRLDKHLNHK
jgi:hypothetical protein